MPKPSLEPTDQVLEKELIETMLAGLKRWRPDLNYPESHSDMQGCARAIMCMFDIKRLPLPRDLKVPCCYCEGTGCFNSVIDGTLHKRTCTHCGGKRVEPGWVGQ